MRQRLFFIIAITFMFYCSAIKPAVGVESEYQVKAAYLYNFAKFIRWPGIAFKNQKSPLVIGVLGQNYFDETLELLSIKTVRDRPVKIRYFTTLNDVDTCHMLYISSNNLAENGLALKKLVNRPIVTVGDDPQFAANGGVIQFITIRNRLRFIINLNVAKANGIQIDSQLLSLATEVLEIKK